MTKFARKGLCSIFVHGALSWHSQTQKFMNTRLDQIEWPTWVVFQCIQETSNKGKTEKGKMGEYRGAQLLDIDGVPWLPPYRAFCHVGFGDWG